MHNNLHSPYAQKNNAEVRPVLDAPGGEGKIFQERSDVQTNVHSVIPGLNEYPSVQRSMEAPDTTKETPESHTTVRRQNSRPTSYAPVIVTREKVEEIAPPEESVLEGSSKAAMGAGSLALNAGYGYVATKLIAGAASPLGMTWLVAPPLAGALIGGAIGRQVGRPLLGANIGAATGVVATTATAAGLGVTLLSGTAASTSGWLMGVGTGLSMLGTVGIPCAAGAALYGLGRWASRAMDIPRSGVLKNMALGLVSPLAIPLGYLLRKR